ncbi:sn-glycerol-1-phosphate dehydrogenase [Saccharibacillus brassicae]|uniref:sn-glycerol-1-phosphate dehydrogenase n=1 Tax=Saccharibacillus brassicae TaxID=2583377 RepID=A0A4Y6UZY1_SACBS|nr:sn-glycerol-1-phosphate dehydrogenase [Saccharibacillus brassicae]QDH22140.1 sn-glycerol-1-phosphate dehydrogenase [Saccharibacillus brassicae]
MSTVTTDWRPILQELAPVIGGTSGVLDTIVLEAGALDLVAGELKRRGLKRPVLVVDGTTQRVAGSRLEQSLREEGIEPDVCVILPDDQGDVLADERSIVQLLLQVPPGAADVLIAVGSGTLHDVTRFAAHRTQLPFVSVPTAPSVDGFTSAGAPIIIRGVKQTVQACAPIAIYADLDILREAPQQMIAAGFGDMLGKYTSLYDWKVSHLLSGESFDERVYEMTKHALDVTVQHSTAIGRRTEEGILALISALIESGLAMLLLGQSYPASGGEHHLSHYWEMEYLRRGNRQLLHGAKVGAACAEIARLYHGAVEHGRYPAGRPEAIDRHGETLRGWLEDVPSEGEIRGLLVAVGGPASRVELGIDDELFMRSMRQAHTVRLNRHTLLRALNEAE